MSAPSIPNLLSIRGTGNGSGTGRGKGRVRTRAPPPIASAVDTNTDTNTNTDRCARHDAAIQATDTDAAVSRLSAIAAGYLDDPYAAYFVSRASDADADADDHDKDHDHAGMSLPLPLPTQSQQRLPIINRGTYVRTVAIDAKIRDFLSPCYDNDNGPSERQIISLGAGTDTRPFRFFAPSSNDDDDEQQPSLSQRPRLTYHEIDFAVTSRRKLRTVQSHPVLSRVLTAPETLTPHTWTAKPVCGDGVYYCHGLDLRDLRVDHATNSNSNSNSNDDNAELIALRCLLRADIPTLILSECCLCYLEADAAERVLRFFAAPLVVADNVTTALIYEPVPLDDAFGRVMVSNLAARGIHIPGMRRHRTPRDQVRRLRDAGFVDDVECHTIDHLWDARVTPADKERVQRLQRLDEEEEWKLLAAHYVVVWGVWRPKIKKHP